MLKRPVLALLLMSSLAIGAPKDSAPTTKCCENLSGASFVELRLAAPLDTAIQQGDQSFQFPLGLSPFAAFRLPAGTSQVLVTTRLTGFGRSNLKLLCPTFTFLDVQQEPVAVVSAPASYNPPGMFSGAKWDTVVSVPPDAQFVVIHTPVSVIGSLEPAHIPGTPGYAFFNGKAYSYVPGTASDEGFPCANTGKFSVQAR